MRDAGPLVEGDREEHHGESGDDDVHVHRDDRGRLADAVVGELVLTRGGVDTEPDAEHRRDDRRPENELGAGPTCGMRDLLVH